MQQLNSVVTAQENVDWRRMADEDWSEGYSRTRRRRRSGSADVLKIDYWSSSIWEQEQKEKYIMEQEHKQQEEQQRHQEEDRRLQEEERRLQEEEQRLQEEERRLQEEEEDRVFRECFPFVPSRAPSVQTLRSLELQVAMDDCPEPPTALPSHGVRYFGY